MSAELSGKAENNHDLWYNKDRNRKEILLCQITKDTPKKNWILLNGITTK